MLPMFVKLVVYCCVLIFSLCGSSADTLDELLDVCIDAKYHKSAPGPESNLFKQCSPWKERSCCTADTTTALHQDALYTFNYDHCAARARMSDACRKHFLQDHCFYECSPNVGPWIQQEHQRTWRKERFYGVPLCAGDCNAWFNDCKDDFTCTDNWSRNFDWFNVTQLVGDGEKRGEGVRCKTGAASCKVNVCPEGAACVTFQQMFSNASYFCNKVWDGSWRSTSDEQPCMRLWFNPSEGGNPNKAVARIYAEAVATISAAASNHFIGQNIVMVMIWVVAVMAVMVGMI